MPTFYELQDGATTYFMETGAKRININSRGILAEVTLRASELHQLVPWLDYNAIEGATVTVTDTDWVIGSWHPKHHEPKQPTIDVARAASLDNFNKHYTKV